MWTIPGVSSNGYDPAYSSIWPGIGGDGYAPGGAGELIQDGTEEDAAASQIPTTYFWFELVDSTPGAPNENQEELTNIVPNPGDQVGAEADYSAGVAYFTLCDYTQNICGDGNQTSDAPGPEAEMIVERTQVNGQLPDLADFHSVRLTDCVYNYVDSPEGGHAIPIKSYGSPITMQVNPPTGHVLAQPGALDSTGTA